MSAPLWQLSDELIEATQMYRFAAAIGRQYGFAPRDYEALQHWSVKQPEQFWEAIWQFGEVIASMPATAVLSDGDRFPGARWFVGARLNFAENLLRYRDQRTAIVALLENGERRTLSYADLYHEVARMAAALRARGVGPGDRVAAFMPNVPETLIAMLAAVSLGAVFSSCSPDFGYNGVIDRFGQIAPKVLICCDGYYFNGKTIDVRQQVAELSAALDSVALLVTVAVTGEPWPALPRCVAWAMLSSENDATEIEFAELPFDHPLYIVYSSGTTGQPKCIVHGAGGTLLQHLKEHRLHTDIRRDDTLFYFTTCGWMMWNWLVSGLASGCTLVLYDGSPMVREGYALLDAIDAESITVFGTSARFIGALEKAGHRPRVSHRLDTLRTILSTGSPLLPENYAYVYRDIKHEVLLASIAGGTDIASCFVLGNPMLPVYEGEIQCRGLGMAVEVFDDDGRAVVGEKGELVCTQPFPSAPVGFFNDPDGERYHKAYFDRWPGIWAHGDYAELTERGTVIIYGRSDAVLNPGGVRIGTAEIYCQVEKVDEVVDSVVIGQRFAGDVRVVLFVVLRDSLLLDDALVGRIRATVRANTTPRHVPARIVQVPVVPRTISGKVVELAVRNIVHGEPVKNADALANPEALEHFRNRPELAD